MLYYNFFISSSIPQFFILFPRSHPRPPNTVGLYIPLNEGQLCAIQRLSADVVAEGQPRR